MQQKDKIIYFENLIVLIGNLYFTYKNPYTDLSGLIDLDDVKRKNYDDFIYENKSLLIYDINSFLEKSDPEIILYLIHTYDTLSLKLCTSFNSNNWLINDILEFRWYNGDTRLLLLLIKNILSELKGIDHT